jgi:hypothetical protein
VVVFGRYACGDKARIRLSGEAEGRQVSFEIPVELPQKEPKNDALAVTWARRKIESLTDTMTVQGEKPELIEQVTNIALEYRLMTKYTSFVAVDEDKLKSTGVDPSALRKIGVPVPLPEGMQYEGVFGRDNFEELVKQINGVPAPVPTGGESGVRGEWGWKQTYVAIGYWTMALIGLALAMLVVFLAGLKRGRFVSGTLFLGLFAFGFGLLDTVTGMIDTCTVIASKGGGNLADLAEGISKSLVSTYMGLLVAMCGGLFAVVLRWRNRCLTKREAVEEEETSQ